MFLTDGYIHVAVLKTKGEAAPDMGAHGPHFTGIHHFGFEVDDLDEAGQKLEAAHGQRLTRKEVSDAEMRDGIHANFEQKWSGPTASCSTSRTPAGKARTRREDASSRAEAINQRLTANVDPGTRRDDGK